jgi:hypothetical protein
MTVANTEQDLAYARKAAADSDSVYAAYLLLCYENRRYCAQCDKTFDSERFYNSFVREDDTVSSCNYNVFVQFESGPDIEFNMQALTVELAEREVRDEFPLATEIWITSMTEETV